MRVRKKPYPNTMTNAKYEQNLMDVSNKVFTRICEPHGLFD